MKAEDLHLQELIDFSEGNLNLQGRRLVLHSIHAFGQFRKDLLDMLGPEHTRRVFTRFGFFWGQADAAALKRILDWDDPLELIRAGFKMQNLEGIATPEIKRLEIDSENNRVDIEVVWRDSGEAEEHLVEVGWAEEPICWKLVGFASGLVSFCLGKSVYFIEKECRAKGDDFCLAVGKDQASWGEELKPYLQYFEAEDIKSNVENLTKELKKKMKELAQQRKELKIWKRKGLASFAEVRSKALEQVLDVSERVAKFDSSVLITGETGVGKEVMARFIHENSPRANRAFVTINCAALPETLLESELFGHKAGSFTGASHDRSGLLEQAEKGTIFLDEIGDISPAIQLKILRVLQEKEILRVGENKPRKVDVRIIAATNRDLDKGVEEGKFRDDLLYRLRVIEIEIPPLRERREDILPLVRYFTIRLSKKLNLPNLRLDPSCVNYLQHYAWPGNVRELENAIERAAVLSPDGVMLPEYLPPHIQKQVSVDQAEGGPLQKSLEQVEQDYIRRVLQATGNNQTHAARILGISPSTLWRKLKKEN